MINLLFRKNDNDGADITIDFDIKTLDDLKDKAAKKSKAEYENSIRIEIKEKLFHKYQIFDLGGLPSRYEMNLKERKLIDAIIDEMISELGLIDG